MIEVAGINGPTFLNVSYSLIQLLLGYLRSQEKKEECVPQNGEREDEAIHPLFSLVLLFYSSLGRLFF
jgi:hypothetical protein